MNGNIYASHSCYRKMQRRTTRVESDIHHTKHKSETDKTKNKGQNMNIEDYLIEHTLDARTDNALELLLTLFYHCN